MIYLFGPLCILLIYYLIKAMLYRKTSYYAASHKPYVGVVFNKGNYGEYLTYRYLKAYENDGAKFLFNCYLPKENGETTEVDVIMIHRTGIYAFESKNYSGWIFGSENQKTWTQTLPSGKKSVKSHFLNPIMQNKLHIKWLQNQVGEDKLIHSIIVFSERCTLKKVDVTSRDIFVVKRNDIGRVVHRIVKSTGDVLTQEEIVEIYAKLYPFTQVSDELKEQHIQNIKVNHGMVTEAPVEEAAPLKCPRCGSDLVLRTAKRRENAGNQFYGCSNYPKCKYIQNL